MVAMPAETAGETAVLWACVGRGVTSQMQPTLLAMMATAPRPMPIDLQWVSQLWRASGGTE